MKRKSCLFCHYDQEGQPSLNVTWNYEAMSYYGSLWSTLSGGHLEMRCHWTILYQQVLSILKYRNPGPVTTNNCEYIQDDVYTRKQGSGGDPVHDDVVMFT